jgi:hypothetical protein
MGQALGMQVQTPTAATKNVRPKRRAGLAIESMARSQNATPAPPIERKQPTVTEEKVRLRAYEIYLERGGNAGNAVGDWLQAERELLAN